MNPLNTTPLTIEALLADPFASAAFAAWFRENDKGTDGYSDFDCSDNFRACRVNVPEELEAFETAERHGCCGSVTFETTDDAGTIWRFGFNYGH